MPELPEVETTARGLNRQIKGRVIKSVWMDPQKPINLTTGQSWSKIQKALVGQKIKSVTRRAKFVVINFAARGALWIHQKMTGYFLVGRQLTDPYIRVSFTLSDGLKFGLSDVRRFARLILVPSDSDYRKIPELAQLGPEPLELSSKDWQIMWQNKRGIVKPTLMNPSFVAGVGNIYADEILHQAFIHPFSRIERLNRADFNQIFKILRRVLKSAILAGGSSVNNYRTTDGTKGGYQNKHRVYQRAGQKCTLCARGLIVRQVRFGRSTHFCPRHQILKS